MKEGKRVVGEGCGGGMRERGDGKGSGERRGIGVWERDGNREERDGRWKGKGRGVKRRSHECASLARRVVE